MKTFAVLQAGSVGPAPRVVVAFVAICVGMSVIFKAMAIFALCLASLGGGP